MCSNSLCFVIKGEKGDVGPAGLPGWSGFIVSQFICSANKRSHFIADNICPLMSPSIICPIQLFFSVFVCVCFFTKGLPGVRGESGDQGEKGKQVNLDSVGEKLCI